MIEGVNLRSRQSVITAIVAGVPIVTLGAWIWAGAGYTKDLERNTSDIQEIKAHVAKTVEINQSQEVSIAQLKVMFETIQADIAEIKYSLRTLNERQTKYSR